MYVISNNFFRSAINIFSGLQKHICYLLCFYFITATLSAQQLTYNDSLVLRLKLAKEKDVPSILVEAAIHFQFVNTDTAMLLANEALQKAERLNDKPKQMDALTQIAQAFQNKSDYYQSITYFLKVIPWLEQQQLEKKLSSCYNSMGINYYYLQNFELAADYFKKAAALKLKQQDIASYAKITANLAGVLINVNRHQEAMVLLKEAERNLKLKNETQLLGNIYNTFGGIYQMAYNNLDSAEYFYRKALAMIDVDQRGSEPFLIPAYTNVGMICEMKNNFAEAELNLLSALRIANKIEWSIGKITIYDYLSKTYAKQKKFEKALEFTNYLIEFKDSIFNQQKEKEVAELATKYETEKAKQLVQEKELELQQARNTTLIGVIVGISLLMSVLIILIYFRFKRRVDEQVKQAKEKFYANVVHEIRTPLSMIKAPIKLLQSKTTDTDTLQHLAMADRNINRLNELVNQMLSIAKLDAAKLIINESFGKLSDFFENLNTNYQEKAKEKKQQLVLTADFITNAAQFDKDALEKIINNLVDNALKYTPENGKVGLDVSSTETNLNITVWDNGIGIAEGEQSEIFSRFYRSKSAEQSSTKGVGIGLALVKELVEALHGSIEVQSKVNEGAVFSVSLPLHRVNDYSTLATASNAHSILLVEDDEDILAFNKKLLEEKNYSVLIARNGDEALKALDIQLPEIVITDLMMPGKTGGELLQDIRKDINLEHLPVIVLSAKGSADERLKNLALGAQAYLTKPFLPDELLLTVANQLSILEKRKTAFIETVSEPLKTVEERYVGNEPYTQKFFKLVFQQLDNSEYTIEQMADAMATNRSHFQRKIKALTGYSPSELIKLIRLEKAKELLQNKKHNITEVAYMCGFSSQSYFSKSFAQQFSKSPSEFLKEKS